MGINFPNAPATGDTWPNPPVDGLPIYTWDGEKWTTVGTGYGTGGSGGGSTVYMSDTPPVGAPAGSLWYETDTGLFYVQYDDGSSMQWVIIVLPVASDATSLGAVAYDTPQTLTAVQKAQARTNISAAPFSAMSYGGIQVNGGMEISTQHGGSAVLTPAGATFTYVVDNWSIERVGPSVLSGQQKTMLDGPPPGFTHFMQLDVTTPQPTIGGDYVRFRSDIEGTRGSQLALGTPSALPFIVGFWMRASIPGTYRFTVTSGDGSGNSGWFPFTIDASAVWQYVTIRIPPQTTGTWATDSSGGIRFLIEVASSATPNIAGAVGQFAALTGVVILPGTEVPTAAQSPFIVRSGAEEGKICARYSQRIDGIIFSGNPGAAGMRMDNQYGWPLGQLRVVPTITTSNIVYTNSSGVTFGNSNHMFYAPTWTATAGLQVSLATGTVFADARI